MSDRGLPACQQHQSRGACIISIRTSSQRFQRYRVRDRGGASGRPRLNRTFGRSLEVGLCPSVLIPRSDLSPMVAAVGAQAPPTNALSRKTLDEGAAAHLSDCPPQWCNQSALSLAPPDAGRRNYRRGEDDDVTASKVVLASSNRIRELNAPALGRKTRWKAEILLAGLGQVALKNRSCSRSQPEPFSDGDHFVSGVARSTLTDRLAPARTPASAHITSARRGPAADLPPWVAEPPAIAASPLLNRPETEEAAPLGQPQARYRLMQALALFADAGGNERRSAHDGRSSS